MAKEFLKAIKKVYEDGDLDKMLALGYKYYKITGYSLLEYLHEMKMVKRAKAYLEYASKQPRGIEGAPFTVMILAINSAEVLKDVICYMDMEGGLNNEK